MSYEGMALLQCGRSGFAGNGQGSIVARDGSVRAPETGGEAVLPSPPRRVLLGMNRREVIDAGIRGVTYSPTPSPTPAPSSLRSGML